MKDERVAVETMEEVVEITAGLELSTAAALEVETGAGRVAVDILGVVDCTVGFGCTGVVVEVVRRAVVSGTGAGGAGEPPPPSPRVPRRESKSPTPRSRLSRRFSTESTKPPTTGIPLRSSLIALNFLSTASASRWNRAASNLPFASVTGPFARP